MMRILNLTSGNLYGGGETVLTTIARNASVVPEMEYHFGVCFPGRLASELEAAGAPPVSLGEVRLSRPWTVRHARRLVRAAVAERKIELGICHSAWSLAVFGPALRSIGIPLVLWLHDRADPSHWLYKISGRTPPDLVLCNSDFVESGVSTIYPGVGSEVLHYPVELSAPGLEDEERAALRAELDTAPDAVVIVQVSRMEPWKGHREHLEALARIRDLSGWVCWFVGGAQRPKEVRYVAELRRLAAELGVADRVRFVGQRSDIPALTAAADIHCQPNSQPEPFGITFVEGLRAGLPVITFAMGGAVEIVNDDCGILVAPGDIPALAAGLRGLASDPAKRSTLGARGPARARALCDPPQQLRRLRDILSRVPSG